MSGDGDEIFDALSSLPSFPDPMARYRGFRRVLLETDDGPRVLREIIAWCRLLSVARPAAGTTADTRAFHDGERHIGVQIMHTLHTEPRERPAQAKRTKG